MVARRDDTGEGRRDAALAALTARRPKLVRDLQRAAVRLALRHWEVTADDLRAVVPIPDGVRPAVVGAAVRGLASAGVLVRVGYRNSKRPAAHARPVAVWRVADVAAADAWLVTHPAIEDTEAEATDAD